LTAFLSLARDVTEAKRR